MNAFNLRTLMLSAIAIASMGLTACGSSFSCTDTGKCSKDVALSGAALTACQKQLAGKCGSQAKDFGSCAKSNETCNADGTPDGNNTLSKCSTQFAALTSCCQSNPSECQ